MFARNYGALDLSDVELRLKHPRHNIEDKLVGPAPVRLWSRCCHIFSAQVGQVMCSFLNVEDVGINHMQAPFEYSHFVYIRIRTYHIQEMRSN